MAFPIVTTQFFGICTHMDHPPDVFDPLGDPVEWRVVLVDGSQQAIHNSRVHGMGILPHVARLQLRAGDIVTMSDVNTGGFTAIGDGSYLTWTLNNVILSIANALPGPLALENLDLPHLDGLCDNNLGPPSTCMTLDAVPTRAAAYFDFFSGSIECKSYRQACLGVLTNQTIGYPQLRARSFSSSQDVLSITLNPDSIISVINEPLDENDDNLADFLLHFLNAEMFPEGAHPPLDPVCGCPGLTGDDPNPDPYKYNLPNGHFTTLQGCSNSTFP